jgi:hypothetical protein
VRTHPSACAVCDNGRYADSDDDGMGYGMCPMCRRTRPDQGAVLNEGGGIGATVDDLGNGDGSP